MESEGEQRRRELPFFEAVDLRFISPPSLVILDAILFNHAMISFSYLDVASTFRPLCCHSNLFTVPL